jgi:hypothetical protein
VKASSTSFPTYYTTLAGAPRGYEQWEAITREYSKIQRNGELTLEQTICCVEIGTQITYGCRVFLSLGCSSGRGKYGALDLYPAGRNFSLVNKTTNAVERKLLEGRFGRRAN